MFKKQLAAVNVLLSIAFAISLFNEGLALKCYECKSSQDDSDKCWANPKGLDMVECGADATTPAAPTTSPTPTTTPAPTTTPKPTTTPAPTATPEPTTTPAAAAQSSRIRRNADSTEVKTDPPPTTEWECAQLVYTDTNNHKNVARQCVAKSSPGYCDLSKKEKDIKEVSFCGVCTGDGCNSSSTLTLGFITFLVPMSIIMLLTQ